MWQKLGQDNTAVLQLKIQLNFHYTLKFIHSSAFYFLNGNSQSMAYFLVFTHRNGSISFPFSLTLCFCTCSDLLSISLVFDRFATGNSFENSWIQKLNNCNPFLSRAEQSIPWALRASQLHRVPYWWFLPSAAGKLKRLNNLIHRTEKLTATVQYVRYYKGHWHSNFIKRSANTLDNHIVFWHY